jgi:hypothetical protein
MIILIGHVCEVCVHKARGGDNWKFWASNLQLGFHISDILLFLDRENVNGPGTVIHFEKTIVSVS